MPASGCCPHRRRGPAAGRDVSVTGSGSLVVMTLMSGLSLQNSCDFFSKAHFSFLLRRIQIFFASTPGRDFCSIPDSLSAQSWETSRPKDRRETAAASAVAPVRGFEHKACCLRHRRDPGESVWEADRGPFQVECSYIKGSPGNPASSETSVQGPRNARPASVPARVALRSTLVRTRASSVPVRHPGSRGTLLGGASLLP